MDEPVTLLPTNPFPSSTLSSFNTSENNATQPFSCSKNSPYPAESRYLYGALGGLLSTYITVVNSFVFVLFIRNRAVQRVPGHIFIVGLMVSSDVIIGIIPLPGYLLDTLCGGWPLPSWACDVWITLDYISTNVSMISVTTVAFDRFLATNFVFAHKRWMHQTNQIRLCLFLWIVTTARNVAMFPAWANITDFRKNEAPGRCGHPIYFNFTMGIVQRSVALYIPVVLLIFFYSAVVFRIIQSSSQIRMDSRRRNQKRSGGGHIRGKIIARTTIQSEGPTTAPTTAANAPNNNNNNNNNNSSNTLNSSPARSEILSVKRDAIQPVHGFRRSTLRNRLLKSFRIVTCVIVSFLLANLPWHVIENMIASKTTSVRKNDPIYILFWIMNYMNALLNPLLYIFMHREYKRAILKWIFCRFARDAHPHGVCRDPACRQGGQHRSFTRSRASCLPIAITESTIDDQNDSVIFANSLPQERSDSLSTGDQRIQRLSSDSLTQRSRQSNHLPLIRFSAKSRNSPYH